MPAIEDVERLEITVKGTFPPEHKEKYHVIITEKKGIKKLFDILNKSLPADPAAYEDTGVITVYLKGAKRFSVYLYYPMYFSLSNSEGYYFYDSLKLILEVREQIAAKREEVK